MLLTNYLYIYIHNTIHIYIYGSSPILKSSNYILGTRAIICFQWLLRNTHNPYVLIQKLHMLDFNMVHCLTDSLGGTTAPHMHHIIHIRNLEHEETKY